MHRDEHRFIGNFGSYGTGKTTTSREEIYKHLLITPNTNILIGANVKSQYDQTIKRELELDIPGAFVENYSVQKNEMDIINGTRLLYRSFDDSGKLKSLNLSMAVIVEASETDYETYAQLQTRLRNKHGKAWRKIIAESNPDPGWIRTEMLQIADKIAYYGMVDKSPEPEEDRKNPAVGCHVASTDTNKYLPEGFISDISRNKPLWWVARFVNASFSYAEGLVYPSAPDCYCQDFEIPPDWRRIVAHDYGLHDDAVFLFGALDMKHGVVYIYKELRTNNADLDELTAMYFNGIEDIPSGGLITAPIIDPKSGARRDYNKDSLQNLYLQKGIHFKLGYVSVDARVLRTNTYMLSGRLKIMNRCRDLRDELNEYKYPPRSLDKPTRKEKPMDKNNHGINCLEWICMELPDDPKRLVTGVYNKYGVDPSIIKPQDGILPHALTDDPEEHYGSGAYDISFKL